MAYINIPSEALIKWKRTLVKSSWRSTHFAIAVLFNGLVFLNVLRGFSLHGRIAVVNPYLSVFVFPASIFLGYAGYLMWNIAQQTKAACLLDQDEHEVAMLSISYIAFRVYVLLLGVIFTFLSHRPCPFALIGMSQRRLIGT